MAVPKAKLFALIAVAMMVASAMCVVCIGDNSSGEKATGHIEFGLNGMVKQDFINKGATCEDASYTVDEDKVGTLIIKNFTFETTDTFGLYIQDEGLKEFVVVVEGDNLITSTPSSDNNTSCCITAKCKLTITGDKDSKLTLITGDVSAASDKGSYPIASTTDIHIYGGLTVAATAGKGGMSAGIYLSKGMLSIENSTVIAKATDSEYYSVGIYSENLSINGTDCVVTTESGKCNINDSCATYVTKAASITGAKVDFKAGDVIASEKQSVGFGARTFTISNATIKTVGGDATKGMSAGIGMVGNEADSTITNSIVTSCGGTAALSAGIATATTDKNIRLIGCGLNEVSGGSGAFYSYKATGTVIPDTLDNLVGSKTLKNPSFVTATQSDLYNYKIIKSGVRDLTLDITSPTDGSTVSTETVELKGTSTGYFVHVSVNGTDVGKIQPKDDSYSMEVTLKEGKNTITVTAESINGNTVTEDIEVTYGEPGPEPEPEPETSGGDSNPAIAVMMVFAILAVIGIALYPRKN